MRDEILRPEERDVIGELGNISMGSAATALSGLLGKRVEITVPQVEVVEKERVPALFPERHLLVRVLYQEGLQGENVLFVKEEDAKVMVNLMMGGDGKSGLPEELGEIEVSAVSEAMNQMMGSACTAMSDFLGRRINISPPETIWQDAEEAERSWLEEQREPFFVVVHFRLNIEDIVDSTMLQIIPLSFAQEVVHFLLPQEEPSTSRVEEPPLREEPKREEKERAKVKAQPVEFVEFKKKSEPQKQGNLELLFDVTLPLVVELGRTRLSVREILDLGPGSIIELDKLAGEPVDLYVNDVLFARGEVVVIEENFGIRITEIVSPEERMRSIRETRL
ncbi:flagellar motor switch phosphatase FliY [Candidatus Caldatribacterium sp.]|uniref:flagellar motor switch phosphatase FliY n=1 Tax=Candidatus Caldatribacterium sp. TaxID=2282143 RepID=UPI00384129DD|nr:flagellar motor switch phosphatase FliY [Candidatus Caldatribacterium sp.]